jgi:hypothetical protein
MMSHADWLQSSFENDHPLRATVWPTFRIFLLACLVIARFLSLALGSDAGISDLWLVLGTVTILALVRDSLRRIKQYRQKRDGYRDELVPLAYVLRRYTVPEFGGLFIYLPFPQRAEDEEIWTHIPVLEERRLIRGGPWWLDAHQKPPWLEATHPHICASEVARYKVYRLSAEFSGLLR